MTARRRLPTLSDVAAHAEVSPTTVSYVLGGQSEQMRIASTTQERVRRAAAALRYRPNKGARSLRTSKSATIAVISDFLASGHFASEMLGGASSVAAKHGHVMLIGETEGNPDTERSLVEELLDRRVDAFVYARLVHQRCTVPPQLIDQPLVLLNCVDAAGGCAAVVPDEYAGGQLAVRMLLESERQGDVHIVGVHTAEHDLAGPQRYRGVVEELERSGTELRSVVPCEWTVADAFDAVDAWLDATARPTRLICMNDRVAFGVYQALSKHGLAVGDDVDVVSFDGSDLATWLRPRLTSVGLPFSDLGSTAVSLLLQDEGPGDEIVRLPMPLLAGQSIGRSVSRCVDRRD